MESSGRRPHLGAEVTCNVAFSRFGPVAINDYAKATLRESAARNPYSFDAMQ